jgi:hypothetical protein
MRWSVYAVLLGTMLLTGDSHGDSVTFQCHGERIEKGQSTWGYARPSGDDIRIETTSESVGFAIDRGSRWALESFGRSTLGWLSGDRIERPNGETWTSIDTAREFAACRDEVAAGLWVLRQNGRI